ncbi:MAG: hypothetical protein ACRD0U_14490 [Acidimicrobiales bacterium]
MEVTALVVLLAATGIVFHLTVGLHRALIGDRSWPWRLSLAPAGLGYGLTSPLRGSLIGGVLAIIGGAALISLLANVARGVSAVRRARQQPACEDPEVSRVVGTSGRLGAPITDLERAQRLHCRLRAFVAQLDVAVELGHVGAQAAIAGEVATIAQELHDTLDLVFAERHQLGTAGT